MRVLLVTGSLPPMTCGVGDYTSGLANALAVIDGTRVAVLSSVEAEASAGTFEVFARMRRWDRAEARIVRDVLAQWRPDVVHIQYPTQGYRGPLPWRLPLFLRARGIPVVQTWHEYFPRTLPAIGQARAAWRDLPLALFGSDVVVVRPEYERNTPPWFRALCAGKRFHLIPNAPSVPRIELGAAERGAERARWAPRGKALVVFFGFCYEHKGIDDALAALDPERHHLVIVGGVDSTDPYQANLARRIGEAPLAGYVTMAGFLSPGDAARILAAADAVVLPFRAGGGSWNTSIKAAALQGTFVLTTSTDRTGYDPATNVYYVRPQDPAGIAAGLGTYLGHRLEHPTHELAGPDWPEIARRHVCIYRSNL